jgi:hypothetical protein
MCSSQDFEQFDEVIDDNYQFNEEEYYVDMTMMEAVEFLNRYGVELFIKRLPDSLKDDLYHALDNERLE